MKTISLIPLLIILGSCARNNQAKLNNYAKYNTYKIKITGLSIDDLKNEINNLGYKNTTIFKDSDKSVKYKCELFGYHYMFDFEIEEKENETRASNANNNRKTKAIESVIYCTCFKMNYFGSYEREYHSSISLDKLNKRNYPISDGFSFLIMLCKSISKGKIKFISE